MSYALGIDLGTTYTAAAVARNGRAEVAALGYRATSVPTVVLLTEDGRFLVGDAAERRSSQEPQRVAREFKRRVGDPTPLLLGGTPIAVDRCLAEVLRWVTATISEAEGGPPTAVAVTHPANWGEFKRDVLREALRMVDVDDYRLLPEPVAAATWYAQTERLAPGRTVAVYDLGGGTFDATVLRRRADGQFESLGRTEGIDRLGGIDVDEAVFRYVLRSVGEDAAELADTDDDPRMMTAAAQLRRACVEAKEALSSETSVTIPVWLPGVQHEVLLQRAELEDLVGPLLRPTVDALARVVTSAGLQPDDLDAVLLVGGSSRIPLISRQVSAAFGRPIAVDAHPKHPVALGAALDADAHRPAGASGSSALSGALGPPAATGLATAPVAAPGATAPPTALTTPAGGPPRPNGAGTPVGAPGAPGAFGAPPGPGASGPPGPPSWGSGQGLPSVPSGQNLPRLGYPVPQPGAGSDEYGARRLILAILGATVVLAVIVLMIVVRGRGDDDPTTAIGDTSTTLGGTPEVTQGENVGVTTTAGQESTTTAATIPPGSNLLTGDASPAIDAFEAVQDGPANVYGLTLYPDYASADLQVPGEPTHVDSYMWRDGQVTGGDPAIAVLYEGDVLVASMFPLSDIDPTVIPGLVDRMLQECGEQVDGLELTHVIIQRETDFTEQPQPVQILVYASNEYSEGGYYAFGLDGTFVSDYCE
jgi:actin-like ATPase involved in cell morphogenesis